MDRVEFAASRRGRQDQAIEDLLPKVEQALANYGEEFWWRPLLRQTRLLFNDVLAEDSGGDVTRALREWAALARQIVATLPKTGEPGKYTATTIATWLSTAAINAAASAAADRDPEGLLVEWVTMHDDDVRHAHAVTDGQQRPPGEPFDVDGVPMAFPGDPSAPIELWINCRCVLRPTSVEEPSLIQGSDDGRTEMTDTATAPEVVNQSLPLAWHGVLAPEGVWSGDGRMFAPDSLRFRDLPLPLTWQKASGEGHDGSVTVAKIDSIERVDGMMQATGVFLATPEADEVVGLLAEFGKFGVSVDADDAEFDFDESTGQVTFSSARIASASIVAIPAFAEAFIALGAAPGAQAPAPVGDDEATEPDYCNQDSPDYDPEQCRQEQAEPDGMAAEVAEFVSDKPWSDFTQADYSDDQWYAACCLHRNGSSRSKGDNGLPIKEPSGALNRNGVHAAAGRFGQTQGPAAAKAAAKACIRGAYKQLGEEPPDSLKAADGAEEFGRGPGWITNPKETKRLHDYWTVPGNEGYAKIGWGVPGDFNRCRVEVGEEIGENSPEKTRFLNQICAQWHHDALGYWPGRPTSGETIPAQVGDPAPALSLVAGTLPVPLGAWFANPGLVGPTPLTITDDGHVFGHLCAWETCHTGFKDTCVAPPHSASDYAYFLTGEVNTTTGPVPVGQITLGGGHAPGSLGMRPALAHYDSTSSVVADVACGEDEHGIWLAGMIRPGVTEEQVHALRASALSGDWRVIRGEYELIAALAVNSPGFPVPRVGIHDGGQVSLVAAGVVAPETPFDSDAFADAIALAMQGFKARRERMHALMARVGGGQ